MVLNTYIGGVKAFLGPALGAALMTFFGYAVSDLTQSWLLYQGILFVLVMMFMPDGLAGLFGAARGCAGASAWLRADAACCCACIGAALLLGRGTAFTVEMLQRLFSQDYRAAGRREPGRAVAAHHAVRRAPGHRSPWSTWVVPVALLVVRRGARCAVRARAGRLAAARRRAALAPPHPRDAAGVPHERRPSCSLRGLRKSFGPTEIIRGVDLDLRADERHALIGPNGAGKSTLFHLISGNLAPTAGEIVFDGQRIDGRTPQADQPPRACRARSRSPTSFPSSRVFENLRLAVMRPHGLQYSLLDASSTATRAVREQTERLLEQVRLQRARVDHRRRDVVFGAALAGDRDDARVRPQGDPAGRADGRHVERGDGLHRRADPRGDARAARC